MSDAICSCGRPITDRPALQCAGCRAGDYAHVAKMVGDPLADAAKQFARQPGGCSLHAEQNTLILPWDILVPDNDRIGVMEGGALLTRRYRAAKKAVASHAVAFWRGGMIDGPVQLHALAFFPDGRRRDAGNLRKLVTDSLQEIIYPDDSLVWRETWERGGIDRENPRLEVRIKPYRTEAA